jgi:hypothetical protein
MIDPIKPKHRLTKKPNFKEEKLDSSTIFVSPGVYLRETDVGTIQWDRDIFIPLRDEEPNGNGRIYNIEVGDISDSEVDDFMRRMQQTLRVPPRYFGQLDHPQPTRLTAVRPDSSVSLTTGITMGVEPPPRPRRISTYAEYQRLFGHPVGVSSRGIVREDGTFDVQSYDIVQNPGFRGESTDVDVGGGESMFYNSSMVLPIHKLKKKGVWNRIKGFFQNIYKKWKRVEE